MIIDIFILKKLLSRNVEVIDKQDNIIKGRLIDWDNYSITIQKIISEKPTILKEYVIKKSDIRDISLLS